MRSSFRTYFFVLIVLGIVVSCSKVPSDFLSEKKMQAVLIDMHLAEAMIASDYTTYGDAAQKEALFASVFRKHDISQSVYDSSLVWYGRNLDVYMGVYDRVLVQLNEKKKVFELTQEGLVVVKDTITIWALADSFVFQHSFPEKALYFDIQPEHGYFPGSQILFRLNVWGLNHTMSHYPQVRLSVQHADTTLTVLREIKEDGLFEELIKSISTKDVERVYGYIRLDNRDNNYHKIYVDDIQLDRYNYGTEIKLLKDTLNLSDVKPDSVVVAN